MDSHDRSHTLSTARFRNGRCARYLARCPRFGVGIYASNLLETGTSVARCIYCLEDKSEEHYRKAEHVVPQSFGRFQNNFTLHRTVCDSCNQFFGDTLELSLARDTMEGHARVDHGLQKPTAFKTIRRDSRLSFRIAEGAYAGCHAYRVYSSEEGKVILLPYPQIGFWLSSKNAYEFYRIDDIPPRAELDRMGFDSRHPKAIFGVEIDPDTMTAKLAERAISFHVKGEIPRGENARDILVTVDGTIDNIIWRAVAKIAFNYLAHRQGATFALHPAFDTVRRYVRLGQEPTDAITDAIETAILADEPIEGLRRLGHLITTNIAQDGKSIVAQVSLFNHLTYRVCLARDFCGTIPATIRQGHLFDVTNLKILELGAR
jgi:HNH endonuclease